MTTRSARTARPLAVRQSPPASRHVVTVLLVLLMGLALTAVASPAAGDMTGETRAYVVRFAEGTSAAARAGVLEELALRPVRVIDALGFVLVEGHPDAARAAAGHAAVLDVRAPKRMEAFATPNDPLFPIQWHIPAVQAPRAWDTTRGAGAVVAVLDTGVSTSLTDLSGTRFLPGFDFVNLDADPTDDNGHGSHVAGTVAQTTDNGVGAAGVAPEAAIMPIKVLDGAGAGSDFLVAEGLVFAADNGADVVNLSLGGVNGSVVLHEAVQYAYTRGVTIVAAVGNEGATRISFPAGYEEVVAVGAVRYDLTRTAYSNTGPQLELVGPGGDMSVDQNGDGYGDGILQQTIALGKPDPTCYCFYQGTSMAAPHVAGVAALLVAAGTTDPATIRAALAESAKDLGPAGRDDAYGYGLVQAEAALAAAAAGVEPIAPPPEPDSDTTTPAAPDPGATEPQDIAAVCPSSEVPPHPFEDVETGSTHEFPIACMAWRGIVNGLSPSSYGPGQGVRRDQMASFLVRLLEEVGTPLPSSPPDAFTDDDGSPHEQNINRLASVQIVAGTVDGTFAPSTLVTRAQMATFLVRTTEYVVGQPIDPFLDQFDDDDGNPHEGFIDAVATAGIAQGTGFRTYSPDLTVRRDQMASFLARTLAYLADNGHPPAS